MKQNKFPVLFLTNGITNKWKPYKDFRCKNTQKSLSYARAEHLHVKFYFLLYNIFEILILFLICD